MRLRLKGQKLYQQKADIIPEATFGKYFILGYSNGDVLHICNNWVSDSSGDEVNDQQFTLVESLHGREILAACGFGIADDKVIILTGSEDSFLKVNEYT